MSNTEYFVGEKFIKNRTQLSKNIDFADISNNIEVAAVTYVREILGYTFFKDLLEKYNDQTLSGKEIDLVEIIKYIVAYRAADLTIPFLSFNIKNKGVQTQSGEFSQSVGLEILNYIRNEVKKFAHINENKLKEYLEENKEDFPIWKSKENRSIKSPNLKDSGDIGFDII